MVNPFLDDAAKAAELKRQKLKRATDEHTRNFAKMMAGIIPPPMEGEKGDKGENGRDGRDGVNAPAPISLKNISVQSNAIKVTHTDGTRYTAGVIEVPAPLKGDKGDPGTPGLSIKGEKGDKGDPGKDGIFSGAFKLEDNALTVTYSDGQEIDLGKFDIEQRVMIGGGSHAISRKVGELLDVKLISPTNGQSLTYQSSTKKWINSTVSGGGLVDMDYGDITVSESGTIMTIDSNVISTFGRTLTDDIDAPAARTTLGLGTMALATAANYTTTAGLSAVALTGAYADLSGKPTLGTLAAQNGTFSGTSSGTNTGDQTITLTGNVTGSGTGSFNTAIANNAVTTTTINANAVTNTKMATSTTNTLAGYDNSGNFSNVTIGSGLSLTGGSLSSSGGGTTNNYFGSLVFANTSTPAALTSTSETPFDITKAAYTIAAGTLNAGDVVRVKLAGVYSGTVLPTIRGKIKWGSSIMLDTTAVSGLVTGTNLGWTAFGDFIVQTNGATGAIEAQGFAEFAAAAAAALSINTPNSSTITIDTTVSQQITATIQWGAGGTGQTITLREMSVEILRANSGTAAAAFNSLSPLTTKGDLIAYSGSANIRLAVGAASGMGLMADSNAANGFNWYNKGLDIPGYVSGRYYPCYIGSGSLSTKTITTGTIHTQLFYVSRRTTFTGIAYWCTANASSGSTKTALYMADTSTGTPASLVAGSSVTVATPTTGVTIDATFSGALTLDIGWYHAAIMSDQSMTFTSTTSSNQSCSMYGAGVLPTAGGGVNMTVARAYASGFQDPFGAPTYIEASTQISLWLKAQ